MTVTPAKLVANRRNAKKSTGPRTEQGKARSSKNAVTHGIFCNDLVLQGEDPKVFESFRNAILIQLSPQSIVELMICDRIVTAQWKLRRLNTAEAMTHQTNAQRTVLDQVRRSDEVAEDHDNEDDNPIDEFEAKQRESRLKVIMKMPWPLWIDEIEKLMDENKEYVSPTAAISMSFLKDDGVMERLSRYEQRLELSIHRNLKRLEQMRKQSQSPTQYCPFVAPEAYRESLDMLDDAECEIEAKEERTTRSTKDTRNTKNAEANVSERDSGDSIAAGQQNEAEFNQKTTESTGCQSQGLRYNPRPRSDDLNRVDVGPDRNGNRDACLRTMPREKRT